MERTCILLINVDESIRNLLSLTLEAEFDLVHAASEREGLRLALNSPPDLILLDSAPGLEGTALCRYLKNEPTTATIPIVVLSTQQSKEAQHRALLAGADHFLTKPFSPLALRRALRHASGLHARSRRTSYHHQPPEDSM